MTLRARLIEAATRYERFADLSSLLQEVELVLGGLEDTYRAVAGRTPTAAELQLAISNGARPAIAPNPGRANE